MNLKALSVIAFCLFSVLNCFSQACTTLGQTPGTAFPVCGVDTFMQSTVPQCGGTRLPVPCSDGAQYSDVRPFWYKFTCFSSGTLGFLITPVELSDDYDWQLFDITGKDPNEVFTNSSLFVACNWSGNTGLTGASSAGTKLINCAGTSYPTFSSMPSLIIGHQYLLLLSNFSPSEKGYKLSFGGGTADITDPTLPKLENALASCGGVKVGIKLSKKMKCNSLATDGSDFTLSPANATIIGAVGSGCSSSFDMDSVILTMSGSLTPGNYTLTIKNGVDANTLLDNCDRNITPGETINFTVFPIQPTPMDSLTTVGCAPDVLQLVFRTPMNCNTVAADGSDFIVSGPGAVTVTGASGTCGSNNTTSRIIQVKLSGPIQLGGTYQIRLQQGTDGNTILDECMQQTPAGSFINFVVRDTVSADFNYQVLLGCKIDTIHLSHDGRNGVNSWTWYSGNTQVSRQQNHSIFYTVFDQNTEALKGILLDASTYH